MPRGSVCWRVARMLCLTHLELGPADGAALEAVEHPPLGVPAKLRPVRWCVPLCQTDMASPFFGAPVAGYRRKSILLSTAVCTMYSNCLDCLPGYWMGGEIFDMMPCKNHGSGPNSFSYHYI